MSRQKAQDPPVLLAGEWAAWQKWTNCPPRPGRGSSSSFAVPHTSFARCQRSCEPSGCASQTRSGSQTEAHPTDWWGGCARGCGAHDARGSSADVAVAGRPGAPGDRRPRRAMRGPGGASPRDHRVRPRPRQWMGPGQPRRQHGGPGSAPLHAPRAGRWGQRAAERPLDQGRRSHDRRPWRSMRSARHRTTRTWPCAAPRSRLAVNPVQIGPIPAG